MTEGAQAFFGSMIITGTGIAVLWRLFPDAVDHLLDTVLNWLDRK